jgi:hypothetical protein
MGYDSPWYSSLYDKDADKNFCNYIYTQSGINVFMKDILEVQAANEVKIEELQRQLLLDTKLPWDINHNSDSKRVMHQHVWLTDDEQATLEEIYKPYVQTYEVFVRLTTNYAPKESPQLLGNNWKLQKIFKNCRATKAKAIESRFVLEPNVIDEIINNYFLYMKHGWNPNE